MHAYCVGINRVRQLNSVWQKPQIVLKAINANYPYIVNNPSEAEPIHPELRIQSFMALQQTIKHILDNPFH